VLLERVHRASRQLVGAAMGGWAHGRGRRIHTLKPWSLQ
jgi:hypothetical protein